MEGSGEVTTSPELGEWRPLLIGSVKEVPVFGLSGFSVFCVRILGCLVLVAALRFWFLRPRVQAQDSG